MPLRLRSAGGGSVLLKPPVALAADVSMEVPGYAGATLLTDKSPGTVLRTYTASSSTGVSMTNVSTAADIGLNFSNVVINAGETPILFLHVTLRGDGTNPIHSALKLRYTGSATGAIGNSSYGFGITNPSYSWSLYSLAGVNLKQVRESPFASTGTFTFYVQATCQNTVVFGGEVGGNLTAGYGNMHGTILIVKE